MAGSSAKYRRALKAELAKRGLSLVHGKTHLRIEYPDGRLATTCSITPKADDRVAVDTVLRDLRRYGHIEEL